MLGDSLEGYVNSRYLVKDSEFDEPVKSNSITAIHLTENKTSITRNKDGGRAYPLGEPNRPTRTATDKEDKIEQIKEIINWINVDLSTRYFRKGSTTYCNIYAYDYCYLSGVYIPRVWWTRKSIIELSKGNEVPVLYGDKTAHILSLQSFIQRCCCVKISTGDIRNLTVEALQEWLKEEYLLLSAQASLDTINFLKQKIKRLETAIIQRVKLEKEFGQLLTIPGVGNILAMTIMLEVGDIKRFPRVGNFTSYCRCVPSKRLSDGKSKGCGNRKNGNRYLSWALTEAAQLGRRYNEQFRRYYNRKVAQANTSLATKALGNKLARICYYIIRDQVPFREELMDHYFGTAAVIL